MTTEDIQKKIDEETEKLLEEFHVPKNGYVRAVTVKKLTRQMVAGFYGMDKRVSQVMNATLRTAGSANMGWNLGNVIVRAIGERLIEKGIFESEEDLQKAMMDASEKLTEEAKSSQTPDKIAEHIGDLVKANEDTVARNLYGVEHNHDH